MEYVQHSPDEPARPRLFIPPIRVAEIAQAILDRTLDLGPWAAYTLGYQAHELRLWQVLFWDMPNFEYDTQDGVPRSVAELRYARDILAGQLPSAIFLGLTAVLDDLERINDEIARCIEEGSQYQAREFGSKPAPGESEWERLVTLADRALDIKSPNHRWFLLGRAMGAWQYDDYLPRMPVAFADSRAVGRTALLLPENDRTKFAVLQKLAFVASDPACLDEPSLRRALIKDNPDLWPHDWLDPTGHDWAFADLMRKIHNELSDELLDNLATPSTEFPLPAPEREIPKWDRERHELWYRGALARKVRPIAKNLIKVLDTFQEEGWPDCIYDPVHDDKLKIHYTIASLNSGIEALHVQGDGMGEKLHFHSDGTGERICWTPTHDQE